MEQGPLGSPHRPQAPVGALGCVEEADRAAKTLSLRATSFAPHFGQATDSRLAERTHSSKSCRQLWQVNS